MTLCEKRLTRSFRFSLLPEKRAGLERCGQLGYGAVVVLGHPAYYPRCGFLPAVRFGIRSEYEVPEDVFMALELSSGYLGHVTGIIKYHPAFANI